MSSSKRRRATSVPAHGMRSDSHPDPDCEIIRVISRKRAPSTNSRRKRQQPQRPTPIKVEGNKPRGGDSTSKKRGSRPIPTPTPTPSSSSDSAARNAPSSSLTSRATAKIPMISPPVTPARPKPVPRINLTHLPSSDDDLDDSDDDGSSVEIIDADIFKRAVSQKPTPRLFRDRGQRRYSMCSRPRPSTPIILTDSSSEDSDSESEREQSPSLRYARARSSTPATARRCFERSKSPSPEERQEERPRNVRATTAPPPAFFKRPDQIQQEETCQSMTPDLKSPNIHDNRTLGDTSQPASTAEGTRVNKVKQDKQDTSPSKTTSPLRSIKCETPKSCRPVRPLKDAPLTTGCQRSSSLPSTGDLPITFSFTPTRRRASAARKAPATSVKPKASPANPACGSLKDTKTPIRSNAAEIARLASSACQSGNSPGQNQSSPGSPEYQALIEARSLPPRSPYQFSRALRPSIDRLRESIRSGRVSVPPSKQELRVTDAGRRAIAAEMERRGITSLTSYNEFQVDLMREYSRLLFRSSVPHISMMTLSMNELQDECLEIESRRPAQERTGTAVVKREQPGSIDLKDIFPEYDTSSDDSSDESEDASAGQHACTLRGIFRGIKTEDVKPVVAKQESPGRTRMPIIGPQPLASSPGEKQLRGRVRYLLPRNQQCPTPSPQNPSLFKTPELQRRISMISRGTQTDESIVPVSQKKRHFQDIQDTIPPPSKRRPGKASKGPSPLLKKAAFLATRWDFNRVTTARGASGIKRKTEEGKCK